MIELNEKTAEDLNDLLEYSSSLSMEQYFNVGHYTSDVLEGKQTSEKYEYYMSLTKLAERLMRKYDAKWVGIDKYGDIRSTWETRAFLNQGGFYTILDKEKRDERLTQNIMNTNKISIINAVATFVFGIIVTITTIKTCDREKRRDYREQQKEERELKRDTLRAKHASEADEKISALQKTIDSIKNARSTYYDVVP